MEALWALIADIAALATVILAAGLGRMSRWRALRMVSTAVLVLCTGVALFQINHWCDEFLYRSLSFRDILLIKLLVFAGLLFCLIRSPRRFRRGLKQSFLILAPVFPMFALYGLWSYQTVDLHRVGAGRATAPLLPVASHAPRVVWIVFDELDERMLFDVRPPRIRLPQFDLLRTETIFADHTNPPGPETLWSMPSFLLGRKIYNPKMDTSQLSVQFSNGAEWHDFAAQPNVFREARKDGFNTGLTGWYLPYCRILGNDLSDCTWASLGPTAVCAENLLRYRTFSQKMTYLAGWDARLIFRPLVTYGFLDATPDDALSRRYQNIHAVKVVTENAVRMLRDRRLNFVLIHVPAPHPPGIWNISRHDFAFSDTDYLDNYELADAVLGQIRGALESTGEWDRTTLLVTSDHPYRVQLWMNEHIWNAEMTAVAGTRKYPYVPFFLKLPFQRQAVPYGREFNNVLSGSLLLEVLQGNVSTPEQAIAWIGKH